MDLRVLIVTEHASAKFGGEAALPLHYYRVLRKRNIPVWLVTHARTRAELESLFPADGERITFVPDTVWHRVLWRFSRLLPESLSSFTVGFAMRLISQLYQRRIVRRLVREKGISVIHQPMPVSPKEPSMMFGMGAPVVIGPMNGGMDYPPAFRNMEGRGQRLALAAGRRTAKLMNWLIPGKRRAALLLVANQRTRDALPEGTCSRVETLVENGVDLSLWSPDSSVRRHAAPPVTRYIFVGRLLALKAVDLLLLAFKRASAETPMSLTIVGDGVERDRLERLSRDLGLLGDNSAIESGRVRLLGWMSQADCVGQLQQSDVLVLPSLRECGGAVVLEAMAMEIPVIATAWGGPVDYLDSSCGILVEPESREAVIDGLSKSLARLAKCSRERIVMGKAGRAKVVQYFDWEKKVDRMLEIYRRAITGERVGDSCGASD